ncbi:hypothetical protein O4J56_17605, partial [Nocardiopsis sp. RSe5-2]|nr:hypothetical protein [Nocardiopsis endophytica]
PAPREGSPLARLPGMEAVPERTDPGLAEELLGPQRALGARGRGPRDGVRRAGAARRPAAVGALREAAAFPRPLRFAVIAAGALAADARVTCIALMVGCAIAVTAALADPRPGRGSSG